MSISDQGSAARAGGSRLRLASRLVRTVLERIETGRITVQLPSGDIVSNGGAQSGPDALLVLHDWKAVRRIVTGGAVGFAEGYIAGEWTSPDLPALIEVLARNQGADSLAEGSWLARTANRLWHRINANTRSGSRKNISFHYDLGNEFFAAWLDRGMQYSSAVYEGADDLEAAQQRKLAVVTDLLGVQSGERVLEVGCGWGALMEHLAARGASVTGLTLSREQAAFATDRLAKAGLSDRTEIRIEDYRDCGGAFDRIVSIEMIEAVGARYWSNYFEALKARLAPGGRAVIQAITIRDDLYEGYSRETDFIQRYVFPGGMLPTPDLLRRHAEAAGFAVTEARTFAASYAATLAEWHERFLAEWPKISTLGFDERFRRVWTYYLAYCEGGFRGGTIDVGLYVLTPR